MKQEKKNAELITKQNKKLNKGIEFSALEKKKNKTC